MPKGLQSVPRSQSRLSEAIIANGEDASFEDDSKQQELAYAFEHFSKLSNQLTQSYQHLENRVNHLTTELGIEADARLVALAEKEKLADRLENLLAVLPAGVIVLDVHGRVTDANLSAVEMLGEPLEGELWRSVIQRCFSPRADDGLEISTHDGRRFNIATRSLEQQGQILLLTDQTETRRLQNQLNQHERLTAMGKMVSAMAHQIRTPLSAAMLYAGHLVSSDMPNERRQSAAEKILKRLQHMEQQVRDMLLFVKGELTLDDKLSMAQLQEALQEAIDPLVVENKLLCQWSNSVPGVTIRCHREFLISAVMNLVNNAVQAVTSISKIQIEFKQTEDDRVCITISDNGPGIPADRLADVQQAFVTTKAQGIGLGLAVVNTVAKAHGANFELRRCPDGGTQALLSLPVLNPNETQSEFTQNNNAHEIS